MIFFSKYNCMTIPFIYGFFCRSIANVYRKTHTHCHYLNDVWPISFFLGTSRDRAIIDNNCMFLQFNHIVHVCKRSTRYSMHIFGLFVINTFCSIELNVYVWFLVVNKFVLVRTSTYVKLRYSEICNTKNHFFPFSFWSTRIMDSINCCFLHSL